MADPQTENGYLKIAMEIVEALGRHRIPGQEMQLIWVLLRKTWGWNKKSDYISLSQFAKLTGIDRSSCCHLINSLISKNIIKKSVDRKVNTLIQKYTFNKDYETWKTVDKKPTVVILPTGVDRSINKSVDRKVTHNRYSIDTIQYIMSQLLCDLIKSRRETFKKPDLQTWSKHIDLMIRIDNRDPKEIREVIEWCQADAFWQDNILSTAKLRKQYDALALKMDKKDKKYIASAPEVVDRTGEILKLNPKHDEFMKEIVKGFIKEVK